MDELTDITPAVSTATRPRRARRQDRRSVVRLLFRWQAITTAALAVVALALVALLVEHRPVGALGRGDRLDQVVRTG